MTTDLVVAPAGALALPDDVARVRRACEEIERQWLLELKTPGTKRAYRRCADNWFDWCLDNDVSPLAARREHSAQWSADLHEALAPSSVNQALSAMNSWYEYGLDEYEQVFQIKRTPWRKKHRVDVSDESQTLGLDKDEAKRLQAVAWEYGPLDAAVIETLLGLGLRSAELENANVGSLGESRGHRTLAIVRKRTKKQTLPLPPEAERAIDLHHAARPGALKTDALILCHDGQRLTNRRIAGIVQRCCRAARIGKALSPHGLRHTCATLMLDANVPLRKVQRILGHADPRTTNRYDLARHDLDASPVYDLAKFLAQSPTGNVMTSTSIE
ncbi:tyrosine-type recombinase/integrase [Streptomyces sp. NBC_01242]|uniref:tyrosine-type recombinase/integrase n=1 Tax=Streptomyces sp. NBC_01242 TaxID=2903795 RepID=UPI002252D2B8|nr:tyrosine-type recombinase/integrase [Streptomyces sp. NBC_01242]MCX4799652.1 tyrosine-type recombinase/integrase [Streptomyces sp. NBC_01242]